MNRNDFQKFAVSSRINSSNLDYYTRRIGLTQHIIEDANNGIMVDVFSKLIDERVIFLCTELNADVCNIIKAQLLYLEQIDNSKDIKIYLDSPGGSVYSGLGLLDTIEYIKPDVITINTGLAASMAAVILCSGTKGKRKALKRSRTMIHQPLGYLGFSQASDIEIDAKEINSLKKELHQIISERTGQNYEKVEKDSDRDYWMNAEEALKYGMIDEIVKVKTTL
jgi:ATP-dependent Clp protease protease subunit